ncbi:MAG: CopG family transcriptional regulator [Beutenbergiaceae bacterium]
MGKYSDVNGVPFTEEDIEQWAAEAESEAGYVGKHLGPSGPGRPISVGAQARPFTLRLDAVRRAKLDEVARERHTTPSQLMRELIDAL